MAKRAAKQRIADIYTNIEAARRYVQDLSRDRFEADDEKQQAVLHRLQNASEAATRLKADWPEEYERLERDHPQIEWQMFRDLGNRYRHGYDQINVDLVWNDLHGYTREIQRVLANDLAMLHFPFGYDRKDDEERQL
ncbi:MAG: hypothetical protein QOD51_2171 [Candidatus Eremiobacteraeota bacterium]|nr:hypothetical protein [Candidatus Eremiobacteraeota bacterium]